MRLRLLSLFLCIIAIFPGEGISGEVALFSLDIPSNMERKLTNEQRRKIQSALREVENLLPPTIRESFHSNVRLKFQTLSHQNRELKCDNRTFAKVLPHNTQLILLDQSVLFALTEEPKALKDCPHPNSFELAKATLIHETAHLYDLKNRKLKAHNDYRDSCENLSLSQGLDYFRRRASGELTRKQALCRRYLDARKSVSHNPYFLNIMGWFYRGLLLKRRDNVNHYTSRSPDPYEFQSPEETFAVHMEFFLLDPDYQCRRPVAYKYFSSIFNHQPYSQKSCQSTKLLPIKSFSFQQSKLEYQKFDSKRLYQVQYFFAGEGERLMSRWGHSMFKLVFCSPQRKKVGPECLKDTAFHYVAGFRANVSAVNTNYLSGITGKYNSLLFIQDLKTVVDEYTKGEFRSITSLPLKLNKKQRTLFLDRLKELFWSYRGKYYFFSNNCATEALQLLKAAMPHDKTMQHKSLLTPLGILQELKAMNLLDESVLKDKQQAIEMGHLYPPFSKELKNSLSNLKRFFKEESKIQKMSLKQYMNSPAETREDLIETIFTRDLPFHKFTLAANFLRLEEQVLRNVQDQFADQVRGYLEQKESREQESGQTELSRILTKVENLFEKLNPKRKLFQGYGIPLQNEFSRIPREEVQEVKDRFQRLGEEVKLMGHQLFPQSLNQLEQTLKNRRELLQQFTQ